MIPFDTIATIVLVLVLSFIVVLNKKKLKFQRALGIFFVAMYKTKAGISTIDKIAKRHQKLIKKTALFMIIIGFIGMAIVTFDLSRSIIKLLLGGATPTVGVVLPVQAKGVFYVPFVYWIISIFLILIVHEGSHGVMARALGLPVKKTGLLVMGVLLPLIPGAFVEPDEKKLSKAKTKDQLAVYAAGPFANIIAAFIFLLLLTTALNPIAETLYAKDGVEITSLMAGENPAKQAGIIPGEKIVGIDNKPINDVDEFSKAIRSKHPGDKINLITSNSIYEITLKENPENKKAWLGVYVEQPLANPNIFTKGFIWVKDLVFWLFLLNLGVGLFNLVPLGPIDGGRMLLAVLQKYTPKASAIWKTVSVFILCLLLTNVFAAFF
ncbi:hypothetical protein DRJ22_04310 [Candidatus Woesearchaeota archaeon]|nr:MAG: hypothetical protein B6U93_01835 [Candidatus Woesearchaeota archaeon ex4484_78]RLE45460.1 MAG: hypothetical protein DRJ22_04310 [Candidatus Woesearchaeota archaeon]